MTVGDSLWSDFSYVVSSGVRERVVSSLAGTPKVPKQVSLETGLRIYHVSRALRELRDHGLVELLTPEAKGRGRLYGLTGSGSGLLEFLTDSKRRFVPHGAAGAVPSGFVPKVRASSLLRLVEYLRKTQGEGEVREVLAAWGVNPKDLAEDTWLSVDACARFLEVAESRFGDGSYSFIRSAFAGAVSLFPTVREQLAKRVPLEALAESAPIVYSKDWNYGRIEVETAPRRATFRHFDWMPTPAMCALFHGVYEGVLAARGFRGKVTKTACVREGDASCEYRAEW